MRRFRLISRDPAYDPLQVGRVYEGHLHPYEWNDNVETNALMNPEDWVEVSSGETGFRDTDLGYFAAIAMQGYLANSNEIMVNMDKEEVCQHSILFAQELIKQLENETKI